MRSAPFVLALCFLATACDGGAAPPAGKDPIQEHAHDDLVRHGGTLVEVGGHEVLLEVVHDDSAAVLKVWLMDAVGGALTADAAPALNLVTAAGPAQVVGTLEDGAWVFRDEALRGHPETLRLRLSIGGKSYSPALSHEH